VDDGICFSPGALALLAAVGAVLQGAIVTLFWMYVRSEKAQTTKAEAREAEWKRLALRGADEIIPSLATEVRPQVRDLIRELRELQEPQR
jgi:hypothetical protein